MPKFDKSINKLHLIINQTNVIEKNDIIPNNINNFLHIRKGKLLYKQICNVMKVY